MTFHADPPMHDWPALAGGKPIVTGHQPWLWHPGILAKYLAADAAMSAAGDTTSPLRHVVVDQDVQDALRLALPVVEGQALRVADVRLGGSSLGVPTGCQPALPRIDGGMIGDAAVDTARLRLALGRGPSGGTLAEQVTGVLQDMMRPWIDRPIEPFYATRFGDEPWFAAEVERLLHDAGACVKAYNDAVREAGGRSAEGLLPLGFAGAIPGAGVAELTVEPYRVELPLWKLGWGEPRQRVYADLADSRPALTTEDGEVFSLADEATWLAPRALLLTAWVRRRPDVGLFVHGKGGGIYDRVTERWWQAWRGETLCPMAVASADLTLDFDVPTADARTLRRAVWRRHHLPHNLDRELRLDGSPAREKRELLGRMDDDRDKPRRRAAFHILHRINDDLARLHPEALDAAEKDVRRARVGIRNARLLRKRDWCFGLYAQEAIAGLKQAVTAQRSPSEVSAGFGDS